MVRDHPGVRVMVDHCGFPIQTDDPAAIKLWKEGTLQNYCYWHVFDFL